MTTRWVSERLDADRAERLERERELRDANERLMWQRRNRIQTKPPIMPATNGLVKAVDDFKSAGEMPSKFDLPQHLKDRLEKTSTESPRAEIQNYRKEVLEKYGALIRSDAHKAFLLDELKQTQALKIVRDWLKSDFQMLILAGRPGSGKTLAAIDALCSLRGDLIKARDLSARLNPWGDEADMYPRINMKHPLLILDDLGTEIQSTRFISDLESFISDRQGSNRHGPLRTIITTNLMPKVLRSQYGERIESRLKGIAVDGITGEGDLRG